MLPSHLTVTQPRRPCAHGSQSWTRSAGFRDNTTFDALICCTADTGGTRDNRRSTMDRRRDGMDLGTLHRGTGQLRFTVGRVTARRSPEQSRYAVRSVADGDLDVHGRSVPVG